MARIQKRVTVDVSAAKFGISESDRSARRPDLKIERYNGVSRKQYT
jgi:hypothetical protein